MVRRPERKVAQIRNVPTALHRELKAGDLESTRGAQALEDAAALPIARYPHTDLLPRIWSLRPNFTAYDACYVALAEILDASLLTLDRKLARSAGKIVPVEPG